MFLAGKLSGGQIAGDVYEYELATDDGGKAHAADAASRSIRSVDGSNHPVGIVGSIVDRPAEQITGYQGTAKRAIWVDTGDSARLSRPDWLKNSGATHFWPAARFCHNLGTCEFPS